MKSTFIIGALFAMLIVCSCSKRAPGIAIADRLSGFGSIQSPGGNWVVSLTAQDPGLKITNLKSAKASKELDELTHGKFTASISPSNWENSADAFVFIDSDERVWAFDGTDQTFICEALDADGGTRSFDLHTWTGRIPPEFFRHLPPELTK